MQWWASAFSCVPRETFKNMNREREVCDGSLFCNFNINNKYFRNYRIIQQICAIVLLTEVNCLI